MIKSSFILEPSSPVLQAELDGKEKELEVALLQASTLEKNVRRMTRRNSPGVDLAEDALHVAYFKASMLEKNVRAITARQADHKEKLVKERRRILRA